MKITVIIRLILSIALLVFCWMRKIWAIALSLTLILIGSELTMLSVNKVVKRLNGED